VISNLVRIDEAAVDMQDVGAPGSSADASASSMSASGRGDRLLWPFTAGSAMLNVQKHHGQPAAPFGTYQAAECLGLTNAPGLQPNALVARGQRQRCQRLPRHATSISESNCLLAQWAANSVIEEGPAM
jgi:hypothetical protein